MSQPDPEEQYRTCTECGGDCMPEPIETDDGFRIAFICRQHGLHSVMDPFEGERQQEEKP